MKDNEIIKALECHIKRHCWDDCPNAREEIQFLDKPCSQKIAEDALDLINRQKAEIERLKTEIKKEQLCNLRMTAHSVKIEAYKEFADGLVTMFSNINESLNSEDIVENIKRFSNGVTEKNDFKE